MGILCVCWLVNYLLECRHTENTLWARSLGCPKILGKQSFIATRHCFTKMFLSMLQPFSFTSYSAHHIKSASLRKGRTLRNRLKLIGKRELWLVFTTYFLIVIVLYFWMLCVFESSEHFYTVYTQKSPQKTPDKALTRRSPKEGHTP